MTMLLEILSNNNRYEFEVEKIGTGAVEDAIRSSSNYHAHGVEDDLAISIEEGDKFGDILVLNDDAEEIMLDGKPIVVATWEVIPNENEEI
mgnify:FL=1